MARRCPGPDFAEITAKAENEVGVYKVRIKSGPLSWRRLPSSILRQEDGDEVLIEKVQTVSPKKAKNP